MPGHTYPSAADAERALFELTREQEAQGVSSHGGRVLSIDAYRVMPVAMTDGEDLPRDR